MFTTSHNTTDDICARTFSPWTKCNISFSRVASVIGPNKHCIDQYRSNNWSQSWHEVTNWQEVIANRHALADFQVGTVTIACTYVLISAFPPHLTNIRILNKCSALLFSFSLVSSWSFSWYLIEFPLHTSHLICWTITYLINKPIPKDIDSILRAIPKT